MKCRNCVILEQEALRARSVYEVLRSQEMREHFFKKGYRKVILSVEYFNKDEFYLVEATNAKGHKIIRRERSFEELESSVLGNVQSESLESDLL